MKSLKHIYKASQCSDIDDVNIAIEQVKELIKKGEESDGIYRRLNSLFRLRDKFQEKSRRH